MVSVFLWPEQRKAGPSDDMPRRSFEERKRRQGLRAHMWPGRRRKCAPASTNCRSASMVARAGDVAAQHVDVVARSASVGPETGDFASRYGYAVSLHGSAVPDPGTLLSNPPTPFRCTCPRLHKPRTPRVNPATSRGATSPSTSIPSTSLRYRGRRSAVRTRCVTMHGHNWTDKDTPLRL